MFNPNDRIKIEVDVEIEDAIRSLVVLGRSNGACSSDLYDALKKAIDPKGIYVPPSQVNFEIGTIPYVRIEQSVLNHFFNTHQKKVELKEAEESIITTQNRIEQLKREIGE